MKLIDANKKLLEIADLVEGTINHLDRDDAIDILYQIKHIVRDVNNND